MPPPGVKLRCKRELQHLRDAVKAKNHLILE